jgi:hypothetical protein
MGERRENGMKMRMRIKMKIRMKIKITKKHEDFT